MPAERGLIAAIRTRAARLPKSAARASILSLGIGDDCAVLRPRRDEDLVVTTDLSLENVHFRRDWHSPGSIGHRCLARGLSDLAAMGARPEAAFLSLALPAELTGPWLKGFLDGFMALAERYHVPLAGGDTAKSPSRTHKEAGLVTADIVLLGSVPRGKSLLRSGARSGDLIYVTGSLGGSAAELLELERRPAAFRRAAAAGHPQLYPEPRLAAGRKLMKNGLATAAIDLSDGLSTDLSHLCEESGVSAAIDAEALLSTPGPAWSRRSTAERITNCCLPLSRGRQCPASWGGAGARHWQDQEAGPWTPGRASPGRRAQRACAWWVGALPPGLTLMRSRCPTLDSIRK